MLSLTLILAHVQMHVSDHEGSTGWQLRTLPLKSLPLKTAVTDVKCQFTAEIAR